MDDKINVLVNIFQLYFIELGEVGIINVSFSDISDAFYYKISILDYFVPVMMKRNSKVILYIYFV